MWLSKTRTAMAVVAVVSPTALMGVKEWTVLLHMITRQSVKQSRVASLWLWREESILECDIRSHHIHKQMAACRRDTNPEWFAFSLKDAVVISRDPQEGTSSATCHSLDTQFTYLAHAFSTWWVGPSINCALNKWCALCKELHLNNRHLWYTPWLPP